MHYNYRKFYFNLRCWYCIYVHFTESLDHNQYNLNGNSSLYLLEENFSKPESTLKVSLR